MVNLIVYITYLSLNPLNMFIQEKSGKNIRY